MKNLKKPTKKTIVAGLATVATVTGGAMLSRGVIKQIPMQNAKLAKGAVAGTAIIAAAAYAGPGKNIVRPMFLGLAAMQVISLVTDFANTKMSRSLDGSQGKSFLDDTLGLAGSCGCGNQNQDTYRSLAAPSPALVKYNKVYSPESEDVQEFSFTGA
jgi:hypothetical protein